MVQKHFNTFKHMGLIQTNVWEIGLRIHSVQLITTIGKQLCMHAPAYTLKQKRKGETRKTDGCIMPWRIEIFLKILVRHGIIHLLSPSRVVLKPIRHLPYRVVQWTARYGKHPWSENTSVFVRVVSYRIEVRISLFFTADEVLAFLYS